MRRTPGVTAVARTARAQVLLRRSRRAGGAIVDAAPPGYAIPLDVMVVQPRPYARCAPRGARELGRLGRGTVLLSRTSARLRRLGVGDRLNLTGGSELRVAGIVDDDLAGAAELVLSRSQAGGDTGGQGSCWSRPRGRTGSSAGSRETPPRAYGA